MPAVDGDSTTPTLPQDGTTSSTKRKRADANSANSAAIDPPADKAVKERIRDIWATLEGHGAYSKILNRLESQSQLKEKSSEPDAKRTKLSGASNHKSIAVTVENGSYITLKQFLSEVDAAVTELWRVISKDGASLNGSIHWAYTPDSTDDLVEMAEIKAFKKSFDKIIAIEMKRRSTTPTVNEKSEPDPTKPIINGMIDGAEYVKAEKLEGRTVLSLFGNAQGHKQLFSSFQRPLSWREAEGSQPRTEFTLSEDLIVPLRENGLPNGISSTQLQPVAAEKALTGKKRTFLEVFGPPTNQPSLAPPKALKPGLSRSSSVTWTKPDSSSGNVKKFGFMNEELPTGHWLGYDSVITAQDPKSPEAKRKQRNRALSVGEARITPSESAIEAHLLAKEEALFRSAYSSFAPCRDDSTALIPEATRNQVWRHRIGNQIFDRTFAIDPLLDEDVPKDSMDIETNMPDEEKVFAEAVANFQPPEFMPRSAEKSDKDVDKDTEDLLLEISEMLDTLHSYQRIRNSTLSVDSPNTISQNSALQGLSGTPSTPSTAEHETYALLRSQLTLVVSMLPPYAVAKLNGDQLEELNISRNIIIETDDVRGVMEEDHATRLSKLAPAPNTTNMTGAPARAPTATANQYHARTAQMTRPNTQQQFYNPTQSLSRPGSFQRQNLNNWQSPAQLATVQRPSYVQAQNYATSNYGQQSPRMNATPNARPQPQYTPRPGSAQQALANGTSGYRAPSSGSYSSHVSPYGGSASPSKSMENGTTTYASQQGGYQQQPRPSSGGYMSPQPPTNGIQQRPAQGYAPPGSTSYSGIAGTNHPSSSNSQLQAPSTPIVTQEQQQAALDRQRAQIAQQNLGTVGTQPNGMPNPFGQPQPGAPTARMGS